MKIRIAFIFQRTDIILYNEWEVFLVHDLMRTKQVTTHNKICLTIVENLATNTSQLDPSEDYAMEIIFN